VPLDEGERPVPKKDGKPLKIQNNRQKIFRFHFSFLLLISLLFEQGRQKNWR
jgi:hypothetical protein